MRALPQRCIAVLLLLCLIAGCAQSVPVQTEQLTFEETLRAGLAKFFEKKSYDDITAEEFASVTAMVLQRDSILLDAGKEYTKFVKAELSNQSNILDDASFLADFPQLRKLSVSIEYTPQVLEQISQSENLEELSFDGYYDMDHSCLSELKKLKKLTTSLSWGVTNLHEHLSTLPALPEKILRVYIHFDWEHDASERLWQIASLTNVSQLYLDTAEATDVDLAPLSSFTSLTHMELNLYGAYKCSTPLTGLTQLKELNMNLPENHSSLQMLSDLTGLENLELEFSGSPVDYSFLANMSGLEKLELVNYGGSPDYSAFSGLTGLKNLVLMSDVPQTYETMPVLPKLEDLKATKAKSFDFLHVFPVLKNLIIDIYAPVDEKLELTLEGLKDTTTLENISIFQSGITSEEQSDNIWLSLDGLENNRSLSDVFVSEVRQVDIGALRGLKSLKNVTFFGCEIADFSPMAGKPKLESLSCNDNGLTDISPLAGNTALSSMYLDRNPLDYEIVKRVLPELPALIYFDYDAMFDDNSDIRAWIKANLPQVQSRVDTPIC